MKPILSLLLLLVIFQVQGQTAAMQTVRGQITEQGSLTPIPYANIIVFTEQQALALRRSTAQADSLMRVFMISDEKTSQRMTSSNERGEFSIPQVPIGNVVVYISSQGYEPYVSPVLGLVPGKELNLNIELLLSVQELGAVTVSARRQSSVINDMVTNSGRIFSLDEANRFAGSFGDVSRMAQNYAGVSSANDGVNDVVIRGNTPSGLLWRIDDIDVYNPNHYSDGGSTGGVLSMVNPNLLRSSDFLTGAFPASYSNALSGVFDLKLRHGNTEKHEFTGQIGYSGFELGAEGPLNRHSKASYIANVRYSVLSVVDKLMGSPNAGNNVPEYGDLTAHFNFPTKKAGNFALFMIAGLNRIYFDQTTRGQYFNREGILTNGGGLGIVGLSHTYSFSRKTYSKLSLSYQYSAASSRIDIEDSVDGHRSLFWESLMPSQRASASFYVSSNIRNDLNL